MLPFNIPPYVPQCSDYVTQVIQNRKICGDGPFTARCNEALEALTGAPKALLTTSGTSALEMAAILLDIQPGDEVIMPSFTFVSTANAFALRGAKIVFVDVQPNTMNLDPLCVRAAITPHTRAIVPVHYAGVCCDMDALGDIAREHGLAMVEDAAQAVGSFYKNRPAGSMSDVGCFSFHETKNYSMGEGGAVILNDPHMVERAEIIREKVRTAAASTGDRWINTLGWISVPLSCPASSTPPTCLRSWNSARPSPPRAWPAGSSTTQGWRRWNSAA